MEIKQIMVAYNLSVQENALLVAIHFLCTMYTENLYVRCLLPCGCSNVEVVMMLLL